MYRFFPCSRENWYLRIFAKLYYTNKSRSHIELDFFLSFLTDSLSPGNERNSKSGTVTHQENALGKYSMNHDDHPNLYTVLPYIAFYTIQLESSCIFDDITPNLLRPALRRYHT